MSSTISAQRVVLVARDTKKRASYSLSSIKVEAERYFFSLDHQVFTLSLSEYMTTVLTKQGDNKTEAIGS